MKSTLCMEQNHQEPLWTEEQIMQMTTTFVNAQIRNLQNGGALSARPLIRHMAELYVDSAMPGNTRYENHTEIVDRIANQIADRHHAIWNQLHVLMQRIVEQESGPADLERIRRQWQGLIHSRLDFISSHAAAEETPAMKMPKPPKKERVDQEPSLPLPPENPNPGLDDYIPNRVHTQTPSRSHFFSSLTPWRSTSSSTIVPMTNSEPNHSIQAVMAEPMAEDVHQIEAVTEGRALRRNDATGSPPEVPGVFLQEAQARPIQRIPEPPTNPSPQYPGMPLRDYVVESLRSLRTGENFRERHQQQWYEGAQSQWRADWSRYQTNTSEYQTQQKMSSENRTEEYVSARSAERREKAYEENVKKYEDDQMKRRADRSSSSLSEDLSQSWSSSQRLGRAPLRRPPPPDTPPPEMLMAASGSVASRNTREPIAAPAPQRMPRRVVSFAQHSFSVTYSLAEPPQQLRNPTDENGQIVARQQQNSLDENGQPKGILKNSRPRR